MKIRQFKKAFLVVLMPVFLFCAGCGEAPPTPPDFAVIGTASTESTEGKISYSSFEYTKPESLQGLVLTQEGGMISAAFSGLSKTSDKFPQLNHLEGAQILLSLYALSGAEMNLTSAADGKTLYTASCSLGDFTVESEASGRVTYIKNETTGFTVRFSY